MQESDIPKDVLSKYRSLIRCCSDKINIEEKKEIKKAFETAFIAHKNIKRKSGESYISHPLSVAKIISKEIGLGALAIKCALLHDVVEDSDIKLKEIENLFGKKVSNIIDGLTKISDLVDGASSIQAENFRKMLLTLSDDVNVILIKLADRLDNMRTLEHLEDRKRKKIASETLYIYAPLAHRLGLYTIKTELEDLSLKYTEKEKYFEISNKLNETKKEREKYIKHFLKPIKSKIKKEGFSVSIKGRPKSIFSIRKKMTKQQINFEEVFDKFAIRIITNSSESNEKSDCWKIYSIVTDYYKPNPDRLRDWISTPKTNGYESLHTTVMGPEGHWVEVQIRSERMDQIAEKGLAAHWLYKKDKKNKKEDNLNKWINNIRELLESPEEDAVDFLNEFKLNLYSKEIFVFTPNGELITLPKDSTALDFAFSIHTELGKKCLGTKVNGKLVPISHKLKSGDQIEIISSEKQRPKENWLDFVITSKAKNKIKSSLNEGKKIIAEEGKEVLIRKLKHLKIPFSDKRINELQAYFKLQDSQELFYKIGTGKINNPDLKKYVESRESWYGFFKSKLTRKNNKSEKKEILNNSDSVKKILRFGDEKNELEYKIASCCNPIPGDDVFGFITIEDGIKVHSYNCPNSIRLKTNFSYRTLEANWINVEDLEFSAILEIKGIDSTGIVNKITKIISNDMSVEMESINFKSKNGFFEGIVDIMVKNKIHIKKLIDRLKKIDGIKKVHRKLKT